jgi:SAM-dependent methyltransferase
MQPGSLITGERTVPGVWHENYWFRRHEVVYAACWRCVERRPARFLDAGCGEGYGVALLASHWPRAVGVGLDYDPHVTRHARSAHGSRRTAYLQGALTSIPLPDKTFDIVVSLQTVEHMWSPGDYVRELHRVCRPGGTVVISTPNRLTFSPGVGRREKPGNLFHSREYDAEEIVGELGRWAPSLEVRQLLGVHHGERVAAWEAAHGSIADAQHATAPAAWSAHLAAMVASVTTDDFRLSPRALDASLDLVAVLRAV